MTTLQKQKLYHRRAKEKPLIANPQKTLLFPPRPQRTLLQHCKYKLYSPAVPTKSRPHLALK